jgi:UDP-N-acetylglucosamine:LPS N-acetylglucosamine transferase
VETIARSFEDRCIAKQTAVPPIDVQRVVVVVMTGSIGSLRVNDAVVQLAHHWATRGDRAIVHVTGERDYERVLRHAPRSEGLDYRVVAFGDMIALWGLCDVAVCRAGAVTVAELSALGIPSILVPLPGAPNDHQTKNALILERAGAAIVLPDRDCDGVKLSELLDAIASPEVLERMADGARSLARYGSAHAIARVVLDVRGTK